ncbi:MAG: FxsA family protein [Alphaproteobacteria bacterium]|nr:FxsA family protein [Alphaproteobacteria bacterium]NCQ88448.1 FxsA family protein [Alphaproteobacteria bacterium]NCT05991.1 FxsA family protein [Alphaproteobacteria bacterium]
MLFFVLFLIIPIAEVAVFAAAGDEIGILNTLLLCVLTAIIGGYLVRKQGLATLLRSQENMRNGVLPIDEILDGLCIIVAGIMLCTPGFVTDTIGFLLLIPIIRTFVKTFLIRTGKFSIQGASARTTHSNPSAPHDAIEGQYERIDPKNKN